MILRWFNAHHVTEAGAVLADKFTPAAAQLDTAGAKARGDGMQEIVARLATEVQGLRLNFYQRAKLTNAFKWRLVENGVGKHLADEITRSLVLGALGRQGGQLTESEKPTHSPAKRRSQAADMLTTRGNHFFEEGDLDSALDCYAQVLRDNPRHPEALTNVGSVLFKKGRYIEAEQHFRGALALNPELAAALWNLGNVLRRRGYLSESESALRRAIKLRPDNVDAHSDLGFTLLLSGNTHAARARFQKVLKRKPVDASALLGLAEIAAMEGRWKDAEKLLDRVRDVDPNNTRAVSARAGLRKMTSADADWLRAAQALAESGVDPYEEALLRFAIGKYFDDVREYDRAFGSYKRANDILKSTAEPYDRTARTELVRDLARVYTRRSLAQPAAGASFSATPVFIVGMPRSGTSLVDQIICSHPLASGIGESQFWLQAMREHESVIRDGLIDESLREKLADSYLYTLREHSKASRIVDKTPLNSECLGLIHSVFPNARIIHMQRDPIDTCLSCYFQSFPLTLNFKLDLTDLAHFYKEHRRLIDHWRDVLPAGTMLDVPYADLVADQEGWTRRILDFIDLEWDERCLNFQQSDRSVATASFWQVRQEIYTTSVGRWRNYEKLIGPLLTLRS
jgi:tetratricopeptide (TPR) repeat protein